MWHRWSRAACTLDLTPYSGSLRQTDLAFIDSRSMFDMHNQSNFDSNCFKINEHLPTTFEPEQPVVLPSVLNLIKSRQQERKQFDDELKRDQKQTIDNDQHPLSYAQMGLDDRSGYGGLEDGTTLGH